MVDATVLQQAMHQATKQKYPHLICTTLDQSLLTTLVQMLTVTQTTVPLTNWELQVIVPLNCPRNCPWDCPQFVPEIVHTGSDDDSDSDNCSPGKLGSAGNCSLKLPLILSWSCLTSSDADSVSYNCSPEKLGTAAKGLRPSFIYSWHWYSSMKKKLERFTSFLT